MRNELLYDQLLNDNCITLTWRVGINYIQPHNECARALQPVKRLEGGNTIQQDNDWSFSG